MPDYYDPKDGWAPPRGRTGHMRRTLLSAMMEIVAAIAFLALFAALAWRVFANA